MAQEPVTSPALQSGLPRRGNLFSVWLGRTVLKLCGWQIVGQLPEQPKMLVIVAPHTSNWDFVFGIAAVIALRIDANWIGKHTLFKWGLGPLLRWLGGVPVDRRKAHGVVAQLVAEFELRKHLFLGITPEGTRSRVERWKTGFYHIAQQAQVPLVPAFLDYRLKQIVLCPPFVITGNQPDDFSALQEVFSVATPKNPAQFNSQFS